jgi:hypothetical protein
MQWLGIPSLSMRFLSSSLFPQTSIYISKFRTPSKDFYATWWHFPSLSWQKEKRGSPVKFFQEGGGNWGHDFLQKVGPITQETVYPPWNMYTTLILLYISPTSNLHEMFPIFSKTAYWCMCPSHLILSLISSYPYLTRCVIHNGPAINLILTIDIV